MRKGFTLIELLVVIAIIAILAVVVVLTLNPAALLQQSRDSNRVSDMATLNSTINLYSTDQSGSPGYSLGSSSVVYVSIPDPNATTTAGSNCSSLGLPTLPATYTYHCAGPNYYRNINGTGWIPVNFSSISAGTPLSNLPVDPTNQSSSRLYYTYTTNGAQFETTAVMESAKYQLGGSNDQISGDGGTLASVYEKGSKLGLEPLDYGDSSLVGFWSLNEGVGTTTYDYSGTNATGSWSGTPTGTNGYYSPGKVGNWAGAFDGSTNSMNASSSAVKFTGDFTVSLWVKTTASSTIRMMLSTVNYGNNTGYEFWINTNHFAYFSINFTNYYTHAAAVDNGQWHQIVFVRSGSAGVFYQDGANTYTYTGVVTSSFPNINPSLFIGSDNDNGGTLFNGLLEDIRFYNRALSAAQVAAMYNGGK